VHKLIKIVLIIFFVLSCSNQMRPINYGQDICTHCKMHIIDQQHGAELVSQYGKVFMYDSIECMMNSLSTQNFNDYSMFLVNTYGNPSELSDAQQCVYIIYDGIPSPMGDYLTAFRSNDALDLFDHQDIDAILTWEELKKQYE